MGCAKDFTFFMFSDISMEKTEIVFLSYNLGILKFIDLPEFLEEGSVIQAKVHYSIQSNSNLKWWLHFIS